jgi:enoyl-CoA hydratase/carnithine racemase
MAAEPEIVFDKAADGVATVTLNRPEKLNAFTHGMIARWAEFLEDVADDPQVKVVVVTGKGRGFCAGGDVDEMGERGKLDALTRKNFLWKHVHRIALAVERSDKPIIAAVNGMARGAGADMTLMCDIRIAAESATFAWSYVNLGLIAGDGGTYYLPKIVGMPRALELLWTGRTVTAQEADRVGLVNRVVPDAELAETAHRLAAEIAAQPKEAIQFFRRAAYQGQDHTLYSHLDMVSSHMAVLRETPDHQERVAAFRERRRQARAGK